MIRPRAIRRDDAAGRKHGSMSVAEGPPNTENGEFVDQKAGARFERVEEQVLSPPRLFAAQGAVVAAWAPTSAWRIASAGASGRSIWAAAGSWSAACAAC
jgi:hypothetical protein